MFSTSKQTLKILAAALWLSGGVVLLYKGITLLGMVIVDFSLATALFGSSYVFWQKKIFKQPKL